MKKLILCLFILSMIYSCNHYRQFDYEHLNVATLKKRKLEKGKFQGTKIYKVTDWDAAPHDSSKVEIGIYELSSDIIAQINKKDSLLTIKPLSEDLIPKKLIIVERINYPKDSYFYPLVYKDFRNDDFASNSFKNRVFYPLKMDVLESEKLKYRKRKIVFQTLNFPMKIRLGGGDAITGYTPFSAVNLSIAAGIKVDTYKYRNYHSAKDGSFLNNNINEHSFSTGIFAGPTLIDLDSANTEGLILTKRQSVGLTTGFFIVGAIQKFNIGAGVGFDIAIGAEEKNWKYSFWPPWVGLAIGLSFIK